MLISTVWVVQRNELRNVPILAVTTSGEVFMLRNRFRGECQRDGPVGFLAFRRGERYLPSASPTSLPRLKNARSPDNQIGTEHSHRRLLATGSEDEIPFHLLQRS